MKRLLIALAGMLCLAGSQPAFAVTDLYEAETFSVSGNRVEVTPNPNTSGGAELIFYTNGTATKNVAGPARLRAKLRGSLPCGPEQARARVTVDGTEVFNQLVEFEYVVYIVGNIPSGTHSVAVSFTNDYVEGTAPNFTCDRNLRFDWLKADITDDPPPPTSETKWESHFEYTTPTFGASSEWSAYSCASAARVGTATNPVWRGSRAGRAEVRDGDDSYGERCEWSQGNTSSSNLNSARLYNAGETLWIMHSFYMPNNFAFCGTECSLDYDGGLITQEKQLGSCGTPVLGIVARKLPTEGVVIEQRNSAENDCGNATMKSLWQVRIPTDTWVHVARRIHFDLSPTVGWIETFVNTGAGWNAVPASLDGLSRPRTVITEPLGSVERIYTWTQKEGSNVDHPSQCSSARCTHQRWGIYRNPSVTGTSVLYNDAWAVSSDFGAAYAAAGFAG